MDNLLISKCLLDYLKSKTPNVNLLISVIKGTDDLSKNWLVHVSSLLDAKLPEKYLLSIIIFVGTSRSIHLK